MKKYCYLMVLFLDLGFLTLWLRKNIKEGSIEEVQKHSIILVEEIRVPLKPKQEIVKEEPKPLKEAKKEKNKEVKKEVEKEEPKLTKEEELQLKLSGIRRTSNKEWFIKYRELICEYKEWVDMPQTVHEAFTEEEVRLICRMVETECYDQDFDSKVNVASVAFNRFKSGKFGNTMKEVITSPNQFAYGRKNLTEDTILAVQYAFEMGDTTRGALFFHSMKKTETFNGRTWIFTDRAGHNFY